MQPVLPQAKEMCKKKKKKKQKYTYFLNIAYIVKTVHTHHGSVRTHVAGHRCSIRCVHSGRWRARICVLWSGRPQLRAAAVRVRLHLPARDQIGLQTWMETKRGDVIGIGLSRV